MKKYYGLTLDPEVGETLKKMAKAEDRSLSYFINQILSEVLKNMELAKEESK